MVLNVFFGEMEVITILTCMIPVNNFQWETCCLHLETIFTEEYRGLIESFVTWCNDSHLKLNISRTNELVVDYQRNRRPPVLVFIEGEEVEREDSYNYLGVQINKKISGHYDVTVKLTFNVLGKFPQGVPEISRSREWDARTDNPKTSTKAIAGAEA